MTHLIRRIAGHLFGVAGLPVFALLLISFVLPAHAAVNLRVQGRPPTAPIQAFVRVTSGGQPVEGLNASSFTVRIDGQNIALQNSNVSHPSDDPTQHVSVVFVMDYTPSITDDAAALNAMQTAVNDFITAMNPGDMAAIVKFNNDLGATVVAPFTEIDDTDTTLHQAVASTYLGRGSNILDATQVGVEQFSSVPLPDGPKAVILITDGLDTNSTSTSSDVIGGANSSGIPIFAIGVGTPNQDALDLLGSLADDTGGQFIPAPDEQAITDAYASVSALLTDEYLISIPDSLLVVPITDCAEHELEVTVNAESRAVMFTRRVCDTEPDAFSFQSATNVKPGDTITSLPATITGIEVPAHISVIQGSYSIGCTNTFTRNPGEISNGQTVCIRAKASDQPGTATTSTLTIGGVAGTFTINTRSSGGGGGGGGGGGSTGLPELLLLLGTLALTRRRAA